MKRTKPDIDLDWLARLLLGALFVSEFAGVQVAIFTPDLPIPLVLFILWIVVQGIISLFLASQVWHALRRRNKEKWRLFNMAAICIALQVLGIFRSHQLFAGAAAIADSFLLYLTFHWD